MTEPWLRPAPDTTSQDQIATFPLNFEEPN